MGVLMVLWPVSMASLLNRSSLVDKLLLVGALLFLLLDVMLVRGGVYGIADGVFFMAFLLGMIWIVKKTTPAVARYFAIPLDARPLPLTRKVYAAMCLYTGIQNAWAIDYGMQPSNFHFLGLEHSAALGYGLNVFYLGAMVTLFFGKYIRASWVILFILGGILIPHSLEMFIKNPLNFFSIFISPALWRGDRSAETPSSGWPLLIMAICIAYITTAAGVFKLLDPVWQHGTGFYYSLRVPFFSPKHLWPLLDHWWLVLVSNWLAIVVEVAALPLLLIARTRIYGLLAVVALGLFLAWPMWGIGLVGGPVVLAFAPAWIGLCQEWMMYWPGKNGAAPRSAGGRMPSYAMVLIWWTVFGFVSHIVLKYDRLKHHPPLYGFHQFEVKADPAIQLPSYVEKRLLDAGETLHAVRPYRLWEWVWLLELFDYHHLFERVNFQVRVEDRAGQWYTVSFFDEDGALLPRFSMIGYIQFLKPVDAIRSIRHRDRISQRVANYHGKVLDDVLKFAIRELPDGIEVERAILDIRPIHMPFKYEGNVLPWKENNTYDPFYEFDPATGVGRVIGPVAPYPFEKLDVPAFRDRIIVPVPDTPVDQ